MGRLIIFLAILLAMLLLSCTSQKIKNGVYEGRSQAMYTNEPYVGIARIAFKKEKIADFGFQIIDTSKNEIFDSKYERHFADNEKYQQQCRNDWNGVQKYTEQFRSTKNIDSVDAVSGATWSYNIFKAAVAEAMKSACQ